MNLAVSLIPLSAAGLAAAGCFVVAFLVVVRRRRAVRPDPRGFAECIHMADALVRDRRPAEALAVLQRLTGSHGREAVLHYRLACVHNALGDTVAACQSLRRACAIDPNWIAPARHDPDLRGLWRRGTAADLFSLQAKPGATQGEAA